MSEDLRKLVERLPEIYQPIFRAPEISKSTSRECLDRLKIVESTVETYKKKLGRPLKILDLGCAQGFFSLNLASTGNIVHGVDFLQANIKVCKKIASLYPDFLITFEENQIERVIENIDEQQYDLVLGLSVFHHIAHEHGKCFTKNLLSKLSLKIPVGIFECALAEEPLYWAPSLPENPRELLEGYPFVTQLAMVNTHLSEIKRPIYFTSSKYFLTTESLTRFDSFSSTSHILENGAHGHSRKYFFAKNEICKQYLRRNRDNLHEYSRETKFLQSPPINFNAPKIKANFINEEEATLVRELIPGSLLVDLIKSGTKYNPMLIVTDILDQLAALESAGLYHSDLRVWNVIVTEKGNGRIIDFGSISEDKTDCTLPKNIFLSFLLFAHDTFQMSLPLSLPQNILSDNKSYPLQFENMFLALCQFPYDSWSFALIRELLMNQPHSQSSKSNQVGLTLHLLSELRALDSHHRNQQSKLEGEIGSLRECLSSTQNNLAEAQALLNRMKSSTSWRATGPLRKIMDILKSIAVNR